jgi:L-galactonate dehydratase
MLTLSKVHSHFFHPAVIKDGYYTTPLEAGYSVEMKPESMDRFEYPGKKGISVSVLIASPFA